MGMAGKAATIDGVYCFVPNGQDGRFYASYQVPADDAGAWWVCDRSDARAIEGPFPSYDDALLAVGVRNSGYDAKGNAIEQV